MSARIRKTSPPPTSSPKTTNRPEKKPEEVPASATDPQDRWQRWMVRTKSTIAMLVGFAVIIYLGHFALVAFVFFLQLFVVKEVWDVRLLKLKKQKINDSDVIPIVRTLDWYLFFCATYFFYGRAITTRFGTFFYSHPLLESLATHHSLISFWLFTFGFVGFVLSLKKGMYKIQFMQLGWTLATLVLAVLQSSFHISNILEGLVWFFLPCGLVVVNDIFAFIWGFSCGRTPLIQLSPKKTWEGFIGAIFSTWIIGFILAYFMAQLPYMYCPKVDILAAPVACVPDPIYVLKRYELPTLLVGLLSKLGISWTFVNLYPIQIHTLVLATFASIIAPFGGFFASGFKRAFKIKDFADTIPGHGGITDRMDCQIVMALFAYIYLTTFIRVGSIVDLNAIVHQIMALPANDQLEVYHRLHDVLIGKGLLTV